MILLSPFFEMSCSCKLHVLIVDDNEFNLAILKQFIKGLRIKINLLQMVLKFKCIANAL